MASFVNGCVFTAASAGTGSFVVSAAVTGWQTPAQAGASNGATYRYRAYSADNAQWEIGSGVYTTGTVTLTRALIEASSNGGAATNFTLPPAIALTVFDEDLAQPASSTPLGNAATGAVGTSVTYARADHVHPGREVLTANRTYYVRTDGSDSNDGLANTSGGAFLTIQKAVDVAQSIDINGYTVTIQVGNGTYTGATVIAGQLAGQSNTGASSSFIIQGDTSTPSNVVVNVTGIAFRARFSARVLIRGFRVQSTSINFLVAESSMVFLNNIEFAGGTEAMNVDYGAYVSGAGGSLAVIANYTTFISLSGGANINLFGATLTLTGTPAWSVAFIYQVSPSFAQLSSMTFSGSATGVRYNINGNGVTQTNGGGASYLPGGTAGSTSTGGQYL